MKSSRSESSEEYRKVILGCAIALPTAAVIVAAFVSTKGTNGESLLYRYQTLIAGCLALVAAFIGAHAINKQIGLAREQEDERLRRRNDAARAVIPLALSEITGYVAEVAAAWLTAEPALQNTAAWLEWMKTLKFPPRPNVADALKGMVEAAIAEDRPAFIAMLGTLQIYEARLDAYQENLRISNNATFRINNIRRALYEAVFLHALTGSLFLYARGKADTATAEPDYDQMMSSFNLLKLTPTFGVEELIKNYRDNDKGFTI